VPRVAGVGAGTVSAAMPAMRWSGRLWLRKVILAVDGVFQAAGVISIALGLALAGRHTEIVTAKADHPKKLRVNVLPSQMGRGGYGVAASGDF